jgi:hypothetical protein
MKLVAVVNDGDDTKAAPPRNNRVNDALAIEKQRRCDIM